MPYLDRDGLEYFYSKIAAALNTKADNMVVKKTFENVTCTGNNDPAGWLYFGKVFADSYYEPWMIRYRVHSTMHGQVQGSQYADVMLVGMKEVYYAYRIYNAISNSNYRSYYAHVSYHTKEAGFNSGYPHLLGFRFQSSYNPTTAANARDIRIEILECKNCTFEFFDTMTLYSDVPGTGSTNYGNRYSYDGTTNGVTAYGDRNTSNYVTYQNNLYARAAITANTLVVGDDTGYETARAGVSFSLAHPILWSTTAYAAGANGYSGIYWLHYDRDLATWISGFTSSKWKEVYLVVTVDGGVATIDSTVLTDTLPSSDDGKVYIALGRLGNQTNGHDYFFFQAHHPMFWFKNGKVRQYISDAATVTGHTVAKDVPSNAVFTDTVYSLPAATSSVRGGVKVGSNITLSSDTISVTSSNVTSALGYTPLNKAGDTMTGELILKANQYGDNPITAGINANNSNIRNVNGIYTADAAEGGSEGINFYRDSTHYDSLYANSGNLYFVPNRPLGENGTPIKFLDQGNITPYEAYLQWGGKDFQASYSPIDSAMIPELGANRFAFLKAAGLTIEYSTDGGSTWLDYGANDTNKTALFANSGSFYLGKASAKADNNVNNQLRVTIATGAAGLYTVLNKIAIYMSTNGNTVQVKMDRALENTPDTYITHKDWTSIQGWSGWNILNISSVRTYGNSPGYQYGRIRFTFRQTAINANYGSAGIWKIMGFGGVGWTTPSNMAKTGHLYSYDNAQNATFPANVTATNVTATKFIGPLQGNADTSTSTTNVTASGAASGNASRHVWFSDSSTETKRAYSDSFKWNSQTNTITSNISGTVNGHTVDADVPANAVFTDTVYTLPTASSSTLGGIKVGSNLSISNGVLSATNTTYGVFSTSANGLVPKPGSGDTGKFLKGDGTWATVSSGGTYTLPKASASELGGIKVGTNLSIDSNGVLSATDTTYGTFSTSANGLVPKASSSGDTGKFLRGDGTWQAANNYSLPTASADTLGGIKVGSNLSISNGVLSGKAGTVTSVTIKATSPIAIDSTSAITSSGTRTISHAKSGVTAASKGDTSAQTPDFGGTFKVPSGTVNATGHLTAFADHTVTIPSLTETKVRNALYLDVNDHNSVDAIMKKAYQSWGSTLKLNVYKAGHLLVIIDRSTLYVGWISGSAGNEGLTFDRVAGSTTATASLSGNVVTITCSGSHSITAFYANGVRTT